ncbi:MAG: hypothetical protein RSD17_06460, partial [Oscillospiraceae bacterium]
YYKMSGLYFYDYNSDVKNAIASEIVKQVDRGGKSIELKFANEYSYKTAVSRLFDSKEIYRQIARANLKTSRKISSTQVNYYTQHDKKIIRILFLF